MTLLRTTITTTSNSAEMTGNSCWTSLLEKAPLLGFELDVHWVQRGANPLEVIKDDKGKVESIHLKDDRIAEIPTIVALMLYTVGSCQIYGLLHKHN